MMASRRSTLGGGASAARDSGCRCADPSLLFVSLCDLVADRLIGDGEDSNEFDKFIYRSQV
jgi:hypothetical protein